jgi:hypothetical protein
MKTLLPLGASLAFCILGTTVVNASLISGIAGWGIVIAVPEPTSVVLTVTALTLFALRKVPKGGSSDLCTMTTTRFADANNSKRSVL